MRSAKQSAPTKQSAPDKHPPPDKHSPPDIQSAPDTEPAPEIVAHDPDTDRWTHRIVLLALPWLLFILNPNWTFQGFGSIDSWYYFGHFIHFPRQQKLFPSYAGERLPWLLPGYAFVHLLNPVYGTMALHFLGYYVSVFSLYFIVKQFAGTRAALLAACMMGCYPFFLSSNGTDYVTGGTLCYCLLAFAFLVRSVNAKSPARWVFAAGLSWAAAIFTYIAWVLFTPACLLVYLAAEDLAGRVTTVSRELLRRIARPAIAFGAGVLALWLAMAAAHALIYGNPGTAFQSITISSALFYSRMPANPFTSATFSWSYADWMVFPALTAVLSGMLLLAGFRRTLKSHTGVSKLALAYLYFFAVMVLMTIRTTRLLEFDYFASMLIPAMFIVLGVSVFAVPDRLGKAWFWLVLAAACVISIAPLADPGLYAQPPILAALRPGCLLAAALAIRFIRPQSMPAWTASMLVVGAAAFCLVPAYGGIAWRTHGVNWMNATRRVGMTVQTIASRLPEEKHPAFWFSDSDNGEFSSVMASFLSHGISMRRYPAFDATRHYAPGQVIVLLTSREAAFDLAERATQRAGIALSLLWQQRIAGSGISYWITATEVQAIGLPAVGLNPAPVPLWQLKPGEKKMPGDDASPLPLDQWVAAFGPAEMSMKMAPDGLHVTTQKQRFAYGLMYPELTAPDAGVYRFDLKYRLVQGDIAFGALSADLTHLISQAGEAQVRGASVVKTFTVELRPGDKFRILISNKHPTGNLPSSFVIEELRAFRE